MSQKPKRAKRNKLTGKQRLFVEYYCSNSFNGVDAARKAGYGDENSSDNYYARIASENVRKCNIKAAIDKKMAKTAAKCEITRETQLKDLEKVKTFAVLADNPSAFVSAVREQNEMLGFHRELAPNAEKESKRLAHMDLEKRRFAEKQAEERLNEVSAEQGDRVLESVLDGDSEVVDV